MQDDNRNPKDWTKAVVGTQFGDEGKGAVVDWLGEQANIIARGTGGANAGHTIKVGSDEKLVFHLVPSGILWDSRGTVNIIGSGVAFDPRIMCEELIMLIEHGKSYKNLMIANNAHLVLPTHVLVDRLQEALAGKDKIGTTGRGIGPTYVDHVDRRGLRVSDMLNPDSFRSKLERNLEPKLQLLRSLPKDLVQGVLYQKDLGAGAYWHETDLVDVEPIIANYLAFGRKLKSMITDTDNYLREMVRSGTKRILLEGAQAILLSIDHGLEPNVTTSDSAIAGLAKGVGLSEKQVDVVYGTVKAPYMTRVGSGVFPTELAEDVDDALYPNADINSTDPVEQCVAIRQAGNEFGATTGRPRRVGWLDLPLLRHAIQFGVDQLVLTKMDVLDGCAEIKICVAYEYVGPDYNLGNNKALHSGDRANVAFADDALMSHMKPIYYSFSGWQSPTSDCRSPEQLPEKFKTIIAFIEKNVGVSVSIVSVGPERSQTIVM